MEREPRDIWVYALDDPTKLDYLIANSAIEKGMPVSIVKSGNHKWVTIEAPRLILGILDGLNKKPQIEALYRAEIGNELDRPHSNNIGFDEDLRIKVEAEWWYSRKNKKRAEKVLNGRPRLSIDEKKSIIETNLQDVITDRLNSK